MPSEQPLTDPMFAAAARIVPETDRQHGKPEHKALQV